MIVKQRIFLGDELVATVERPHSFAVKDCGYHPVFSEALICPICLRRWAVLEIEGYERPYNLVGASCAECGYKDNYIAPVPGSILVDFGWDILDTDLLAVLPEPLLKREFQLHIRAYLND